MNVHVTNFTPIHIQFVVCDYKQANCKHIYLCLYKQHVYILSEARNDAFIVETQIDIFTVSLSNDLEKNL